MKQKTNQKLSNRKKLVLKVALLVIALAVISLQLVFDRYVFRWSAPGQNDTIIATLIIQAIQNLNKPAIIEPVSKKVYLPDASLVLPPYPQEFAFGGILYNYQPAFDGSAAQANMTLAQAQNAGIEKIRLTQTGGGRIWTYGPSNVFDAVPNAQACSRGLIVVFGSKPEYDKLEFNKMLADGRTMYVYSERHPCEYNLRPLIEYLRQAQSY